MIALRCFFDVPRVWTPFHTSLSRIYFSSTMITGVVSLHLSLRAAMTLIVRAKSLRYPCGTSLTGLEATDLTGTAIPGFCCTRSLHLYHDVELVGFVFVSGAKAAVSESS